MTAKEQYRSLSANREEYFECQLPIIAETEKAICFNNYDGHLDHEDPVWMPKSRMQIVDGTKEGFDKRYFIETWLYSKLR